MLAIAYPILSVDETAVGLHLGVMGMYLRRGGPVLGPRFGLDLRADPAIAVRGEVNHLGDEGQPLFGLGLRLALQPSTGVSSN